jgi:hypothetical protein
MAMKSMILIAVAAVGLAGCETADTQPTRSATMQQTLDRMVAGKTAGKTESCLPTYRSNDMTVIDEQTLAFRDGRTTWVNNMMGSCSQLGRGGYAIVSRNIGPQLCRGDIATVVDTTTGTTVGSCSYGDFTPYRAAGR